MAKNNLQHVLEIELDKLTDKIFKNMLLVVEELIILMRKYAPFGDGTLKESFRHKIKVDLFGMVVSIYSTSWYAREVNEGLHWHVSKANMGKLGFSKYHSLISDSYFNAVVNRGRFGTMRVEDIKTKQARRYLKGYVAAVDENKAPSDEYEARYIEKAIQEYGGFDHIKKKIING